MISVTVIMDDGVPDDIQAKCLFNLELDMRIRSSLDVRVFKERLADDSPLRRIVDMRRAKK